MDRTTQQKTNMETEDLNNIINKLDLADIYRTLHTTTQNTCSSQVGMEHSLG